MKHIKLFENFNKPIFKSITDVVEYLEELIKDEKLLKSGYESKLMVHVQNNYKSIQIMSNDSKYDRFELINSDEDKYLFSLIETNDKDENPETKSKTIQEKVSEQLFQRILNAAKTIQQHYHDQTDPNSSKYIPNEKDALDEVFDLEIKKHLNYKDKIKNKEFIFDFLYSDLEEKSVRKNIYVWKFIKNVKVKFKNFSRTFFENDNFAYCSILCDIQAGDYILKDYEILIIQNSEALINLKEIDQKLIEKIEKFQNEKILPEKDQTKFFEKIAELQHSLWQYFLLVARVNSMDVKKNNEYISKNNIGNIFMKPHESALHILKEFLTLSQYLKL